MGLAPEVLDDAHYVVFEPAPVEGTRPQILLRLTFTATVDTGIFYSSPPNPSWAD